MAARRGTNAWKSEVTSVFYGISTLTGEVRRITLSRSGVLSCYFDDRPSISHPLGGRTALGELDVVFNLVEILEFSAAMDPSWNDPRISALEEKARQMRAARAAKGTS